MSDTPRTDLVVLRVPDATITAAEGERGQVRQLQAAIQALYEGLEMVGNHARQLERQLNASVKARIQDKIYLEEARTELATAMKQLGNWREFPGVLAVGEPCAGQWIGPPDASLRQWSCPCGATRPEQCKTETPEL